MYPLALHDALPILSLPRRHRHRAFPARILGQQDSHSIWINQTGSGHQDRKSTRLNSSHFDRSDVPSCPTRRSSDLVSSSSSSSSSLSCPHPWAARLSLDLDQPNGVRPPRSEEHTSELQSLRPLGCTLLPYTTLFRSCLFLVVIVIEPFLPASLGSKTLTRSGSTKRGQAT